MEVIILAGGLGTRLRSAIGADVPKCMAPVADRPFLWYLLSYLKQFDVSRVILSVGHLREVIIEWLQKHKGEFPFQFDFAIEETPLGTGGGIRLACSKCEDDDVIVLNGDTFFDVNLRAMLASHCQMQQPITVALKEMTDFDRYGKVDIDADSLRVIQFKEKEYCEVGLINGGVYAISRNKMIWPPREKFSFEKDVLEPLAAMGKVGCYQSNGYFIDIGIPSDYEKANRDFLKWVTK